VAALQRAQELGSNDPLWRFGGAHRVRRVERMAELKEKLPAVLKGESKPADAAEQVVLASLCYYRQLYATAAGFSAEALAAQPELAGDLKAMHRYFAAFNAALAGCGQGKEAAGLDEPQRGRWRKQAVDRLRADLELLSKQIASAQADDRAFAYAVLRGWQADPDLAGLREEAALARLPEAEREACRKLWADVADVLHRAREAK
jgi:hypothetical protein